MQKRCEKLYMEVQKNREMIETLSQSKKDQSNQNNFLETLLIKHDKNNSDKKKFEDKISKQNAMQQKNDINFRNEMKILHKKRRERKKSNQNQESNYNTDTSKNSYNSKGNHDYYDTNNSFVYEDNLRYDYDSYNSNDYSEPDSMLYSNTEKTQTNSSHLDNNDANNKNDYSDKIHPNHDYTQNLKRMIKIVNDLEKNCNQTQPNFDNQACSSSSSFKNKKDIQKSISHSISEQNQLNDNEISTETLDHIHHSLVAAERTF